MSKPDNCPHCGVSLIGAEIPPENQHYYNALDKAPGSPGWITHGRREIGIQVMGDYDGVLYWKCPDCGGVWNRWPEGHYLHARAERAMAKDKG